MKNKLRHIIALILALAMSLCMISVSVYAEEEPQNAANSAQTPYEEPGIDADYYTEPIQFESEESLVNEEPVNQGNQSTSEDDAQPRESADGSAKNPIQPEEAALGLPLPEPTEDSSECVEDAADSSLDNGLQTMENDSFDVSQVTPLTLGKPSMVDSSFGYGNVAKFSYTPAKTSLYCFYSNADGGSYQVTYHDGDEDTIGYLYDNHGTLLTTDDNSGVNNQFAIVERLNAGTTYYFTAQFKNPTICAEYEVVLEELGAAHTLEGSNLTWTIQNDTLILSGKGAMPDYQFAGMQPWRQLHSTFTKIRIESGVTTIGNCAFDDCTTVTNVTMSEGITRIGEKSFRGCSNLIAAAIPNSVKTIGADAFCWCHSLPDVTFPSGLQSIGDCAFFDCPGLQQLTIPDSVTTLGADAFEYCSGIQKVKIGNGLERIGSGAFSNNDRLSNVEIGNRVTAIGESAFYNCLSLEKITIPDCVKTIEDGVFFRCSYLTSISLGKGLVDLGAHSFDDTGLTSIVIPEGVCRIGEKAFYDCSYLKTVTIPQSVKTIEKSAFEKCGDLEQITIPRSVTEIGDRAFYGCTDLVTVLMYDPKPALGKDVFLGSAWWSINYAETSGSCGDGIQWEYDKMSHTLTISGTGEMTSAPYLVYYNHTAGCSIKKVVIQNGVTAIAKNAFLECTGVSDVSIPDSVKSIESGAFGRCFSLKSVTIPDSVTVIGKSAFQACNNLSEVKLGRGLTSIGGHAFSNCNLKKVYLPDGLEKIGTLSFNGNEHMTGIAIPKSVTTIASSAFSDCSSLTIFCEPGSYAESYAKKNGLTSAPLSAWTEEKKNISDAYVYVENQTYTGKPITPVLEVEYDDEELSMQTDYSVSFKNNTKVGTATVIITGIGDYQGTLTESFSILPSKTTLSSAKWDKKKKSLTILWKKNNSGKGYEIHYSTDKKFRKAVKKSTINKNTTTKTVIKQLVPYKTYYIRIRTVNKKFKSGWSSVKFVRIR